MKGKFPTATALVTRVMEALNIDPQAEGAAPRLADQTGLDRVQIFRWLNGIHEPKLPKALELLEAAGLLDWRAPTDPEKLTDEELDRRAQTASARARALRQEQERRLAEQPQGRRR